MPSSDITIVAPVQNTYTFPKPQMAGNDSIAAPVPQMSNWDPSYGPPDPIPIQKPVQTLNWDPSYGIPEQPVSIPKPIESVQPPRVVATDERGQNVYAPITITSPQVTSLQSQFDRGEITVLDAPLPQQLPASYAVSGGQSLSYTFSSPKAVIPTLDDFTNKYFEDKGWAQTREVLSPNLGISISPFKISPSMTTPVSGPQAALAAINVLPPSEQTAAMQELNKQITEAKEAYTTKYGEKEYQRSVASTLPEKTLQAFPALTLVPFLGTGLAASVPIAKGLYGQGGFGAVTPGEWFVGIAGGVGLGVESSRAASKLLNTPINKNLTAARAFDLPEMEVSTYGSTEQQLSLASTTNAPYLATSTPKLLTTPVSTAIVPYSGSGNAAISSLMSTETISQIAKPSVGFLAVGVKEVIPIPSELSVPTGRVGQIENLPIAKGVLPGESTGGNFQADLKALPPPKEGYARLWRGEPILATRIDELRKDYYPEELRGQWFADSDRMAFAYAREANQVYYIDVPKTKLTELESRVPKEASWYPGQYILAPEEQALYGVEMGIEPYPAKGGAIPQAIRGVSGTSPIMSIPGEIQETIIPNKNVMGITTPATIVPTSQTQLDLRSMVDTYRQRDPEYQALLERKNDLTNTLTSVMSRGPKDYVDSLNQQIVEANKKLSSRAQQIRSEVESSVPDVAMRLTEPTVTPATQISVMETGQIQLPLEYNYEPFRAKIQQIYSDVVTKAYNEAGKSVYRAPPLELVNLDSLSAEDQNAWVRGFPDSNGENAHYDTNDHIVRIYYREGGDLVGGHIEAIVGHEAAGHSLGSIPYEDYAKNTYINKLEELKAVYTAAKVSGDLKDFNDTLLENATVGAQKGLTPEELNYVRAAAKKAIGYTGWDPDIKYMRVTPEGREVLTDFSAPKGDPDPNLIIKNPEKYPNLYTNVPIDVETDVKKMFTFSLEDSKAKWEASVSKWQDNLDRSKAQIAEVTKKWTTPPNSKELLEINKINEETQFNIDKGKQLVAEIDTELERRKALSPIVTKGFGAQLPLEASLPISPELGKSIAQTLGVKYDGVQEGYEDIPSMMQFTDPITKSTTYGNTLEEVKTNIERMRRDSDRKTIITEVDNEPIPVEFGGRQTKREKVLAGLSSL